MYERPKVYLIMWKKRKYWPIIQYVIAENTIGIAMKIGICNDNNQLCILNLLTFH